MSWGAPSAFHHSLLSLISLLSPLPQFQLMVTLSWLFYWHVCRSKISSRSGLHWLSPRHPPPGTTNRPTVVVEIAISQTRTRLQRDIDLRVNPNRGNANVAIAIKANRTRPLITIDKYGWDYDNGQAQISQHMEIRDSDTSDQVSVSGAPLTIPFDLLSLRHPQPPREGDHRKGRNWDCKMDLGRLACALPNFIFRSVTFQAHDKCLASDLHCYC